MQTYPITILDRKKQPVVFQDKDQLTLAIRERKLDTVTAGNLMRTLRSDQSFAIWSELYQQFGQSARLRGSLGRVLNGWLTRAAKAGDRSTAEQAYEIVGGTEVSFDDYWRSLGIVVDTDETPAPPAPAKRTVTGSITDRTPNLQNPPRKTKTEAKAKAKPSRRQRAHDEGPKEALGEIYVTTKGQEVLVLDFYGDGRYVRTCPRCKGAEQDTGTYADFGPRVMPRAGRLARVVQPQCKKCRRKAAKSARLQKAAK